METVTDDEVAGLSTMGYQSRITSLINATEPLLALYAVVNDVMEEEDWNSATMVGRIRRAWEECTADLGG